MSKAMQATMTNKELTEYCELLNQRLENQMMGVLVLTDMFQILKAEFDDLKRWKNEQ